MSLAPKGYTSPEQLSVGKPFPTIGPYIALTIDDMAKLRKIALVMMILSFLLPMTPPSVQAQDAASEQKTLNELTQPEYLQILDKVLNAFVPLAKFHKQIVQWRYTPKETAELSSTLSLAGGFYGGLFGGFIGALVGSGVGFTHGLIYAATRGPEWVDPLPLIDLPIRTVERFRTIYTYEVAWLIDYFHQLSDEKGVNSLEAMSKDFFWINQERQKLEQRLMSYIENGITDQLSYEDAQRGVTLSILLLEILINSRNVLVNKLEELMPMGDIQDHIRKQLADAPKMLGLDPTILKK